MPTAPRADRRSRWSRRGWPPQGRSADSAQQTRRAGRDGLYAAAVDERQLHDEGAALARPVAVCGDLAAMLRHQVPHERQPDSDTFHAAARFTHERIEDPFERLASYSNSGIADDDPRVPVFPARGD